MNSGNIPLTEIKKWIHVCVQCFTIYILTTIQRFRLFWFVTEKYFRNESNVCEYRNIEK